MDVASLAADRLAKYYIFNDNLDKAKALYEKVINSNPKYFVQDYDKTLNLARELVDKKAPEIAARLGEILYRSLDKIDGRKQDILLNNARWFKKAGEYDKALEYYDLFLIDFSYVKNIKEIRKEIDFIKFQQDKGTADERVAMYDEIINRYPNDEIASKAKYRKMSALLEQKKYDDVKEYLPTYENLDEKLFPNLKEEVRRIARKLVKNYLDNKKCKDGLDIMNGYNIMLPDTYDETMSQCGFEMGDFDLVVKLSNKYIESQSPADSLAWQRKKANAIYRQSDYLEFILEAERILRTDRALGHQPDKEMYFKLFNAYQNAGQKEKLAGILEEIENYFKGEPRILDLYKVVVENSLNEKNYKKAYQYALDILNRQRIMNVNSFSPFVEFAIAESALNLQTYDQAIDVLESLVKTELKTDDMFQANYRLADLYSLKGEKEKAAVQFNKCSELNGESSWKELCKSQAK